MIWREMKITSSEREVRVIEGSSYRESTVLREGPLEDLWRGRAKYKKKYSRKRKLNEKKFLHAN